MGPKLTTSVDTSSLIKKIIPVAKGYAAKINAARKFQSQRNLGQELDATIKPLWYVAAEAKDRITLNLGVPVVPVGEVVRSYLVQL